MGSNHCIPLRRCIGCYKSRPITELMRYAVDEDGTLVLDEPRMRQGRGAYTCLKRGCLENGLKRNAFFRSFHKKVLIDRPDELMRALETICSKRRDASLENG